MWVVVGLGRQDLGLGLYAGLMETGACTAVATAPSATAATCPQHEPPQRHTWGHTPISE